MRFGSKPKEPPKEEPKVDPPKDPAPSYATKDDLTAINAALQNVTAQLAQFGGRVDVLANDRDRRPEPSSTPTPQPFQRTVSLDQIEAAHDEGDFKKAARLQATYTAETVKEANLQTQAQIAALQQHGLNMIANVVGTQASSGLPHYGRFKKEIDEFLNQLDPGIRANPEAHKWAHDSIVGKHHAELVKEAEEAAIRKAMDGGADVLPNGQPPKPPSDELTIESVYGDDAKSVKDFLKRQGRTFEQHARMNKFANVQDYLKHVKAQRERLEAANG